MEKTKQKPQVSRLFLILTVVYITCLLLSNLIAGKMWGVTQNITLPAAVILFPITYIFGDIFTEVYGFKKARLVIWLGFACSFFAVGIYMATIYLPAASSFENQAAFEAVLGTTPRVCAASFVGYLFGEFSNSVILSRLKIASNGKHLWVRTILSTVVGEGFDSIIFIMGSFAGVMPMKTLWTMVLCQYIFKVAYEIICTPATYAIVKALKKTEGVDVFDAGVKYNVFKVGEIQ